MSVCVLPSTILNSYLTIVLSFLLHLSPFVVAGPPCLRCRSHLPRPARQTQPDRVAKPMIAVAQHCRREPCAVSMAPPFARPPRNPRRHTACWQQQSECAPEWRRSCPGPRWSHRPGRGCDLPCQHRPADLVLHGVVDIYLPQRQKSTYQMLLEPSHPSLVRWDRRSPRPGRGCERLAVLLARIHRGRAFG